MPGRAVRPEMFHIDHGLKENISQCVVEIYTWDLQGNSVTT